MEAGSGFLRMPRGNAWGLFEKALEKGPYQKKLRELKKLKAKCSKSDIDTRTKLLFELWGGMRALRKAPSSMADGTTSAIA